MLIGPIPGFSCVDTIIKILEYLLTDDEKEKCVITGRWEMHFSVWRDGEMEGGMECKG